MPLKFERISRPVNFPWPPLSTALTSRSTRRWNMTGCRGRAKLLVFFMLFLEQSASLLVASGSSGSPQQNPPPPPPPAFALTRLSTDTFTNADGQHATELETSAYSWGSTMVVSFEVARGQGHGGGADIGIAISTDAGATWNSHFLSGLTTAQGGSGVATGNAKLTSDLVNTIRLI